MEPRQPAPRARHEKRHEQSRSFPGPRAETAATHRGSRKGPGRERRSRNSLPGPFRGSGVASSSGGGVRGRYCVQGGRGWVSMELRRNYARRPERDFLLGLKWKPLISRTHKNATRKPLLTLLTSDFGGVGTVAGAPSLAPQVASLPLCNLGRFSEPQSPVFLAIFQVFFVPSHQGTWQPVRQLADRPRSRR